MPEARAQSAGGIPPQKCDVFISYSRRDRDRVQPLVREIEQQGHLVWIDTRATADSRYAGPIVQAIKACRAVALMCSSNAFDSDHVVREVYLAGDYKKRFIAVRLEQSEFPDDFNYFLTGYPRVDATGRSPIEVARDVNRLLAV